MAEKRFQVFVSSTFEDLQSERQEVIHALLEMDCIPSGMELFVATNDDQWTLIQKVIRDSDYYLVIVAGRYGSTDKNGMSYTEKEYRYAQEIGKPTLAFLHKTPSSIPAGKTETTDEGRRRLEAFRTLVTGQKHVKYWTSPHDLGSVVSRSLLNATRTIPAIGWVRADQIASQEASSEILRLRERIDELELNLNAARHKPPAGTEALSQGDDEFNVRFQFRLHTDFLDAESWSADWSVAWNEIFGWISPELINEASEASIRQILNKHIAKLYLEEHGESPEFQGKRLENLEIDFSDFQTIVVQLQALGLITQSSKKKSATDVRTYWTLTPYGTHVMTTLRAIRKDS